MQYTIGQVFQIQISPPRYRFTVDCSEMTDSQFRFLNYLLDKHCDDTYPDFEERRTTVVFSHQEPNRFRDMVGEQVIDGLARTFGITARG